MERSLQLLALDFLHIYYWNLARQPRLALLRRFEATVGHLLVSWIALGHPAH